MFLYLALKEAQAGAAQSTAGAAKLAWKAGVTSQGGLPLTPPAENRAAPHRIISWKVSWRAGWAVLLQKPALEEEKYPGPLLGKVSREPQLRFPVSKLLHSLQTTLEMLLLLTGDLSAWLSIAIQMTTFPLER